MMRFNCCVRRLATGTYIEFDVMAKNRIQACIFITDEFPGWDYVLEPDTSHVRQD